MFVSRVAVSLGILGLKKKSLVKITSPVHNCRMVEVYTMDKLVRVLSNFGVVVSDSNRPFMFSQSCFQGSVSLSIVHEIAINVVSLHIQVS